MKHWHAGRPSHGVCGGLVLIALVGALTIGAAPASAVLYKTGHGYLSYEKIGGKPAPSNVKPPNSLEAPVGQEIFSDQLGYLTYSGGPIMPSNKDFVVNWDPGTFPVGSALGYGTGDSCGTDTSSHTCTGYVAGVNTFFQDLQTASASNAPTSDQAATQYTANGQSPGYSVTSGGTLTDTDPYPASGCPGAPSGGICLTDQQLQTELQSFLAAHSEPGGLTNEYVLLTPPGVATCFDAAGKQCSANAGPGGTPVFCAYHSRTATSGQYVYSNIPDMDNIPGCDSFVSTSPGGDDTCSFFTCIWPNGWADGVLSAVSHEHNESITDPEPDNAWADWSHLRNQPGDENGDKCNFDAADDPNTVYHDNGDFTYTPSNETIGAHRYWVQMQWSNQNLHCVGSYTASGSAPTAAFGVASQSGHTVNFSATPGAAQYVWQFNDDVAPGDSPQQFTETTTSPTITHAFPQAGTYTVAMTAMAADGHSRGVSHNVTVSNPPPPPPPAGPPNTTITKTKLKAKKKKAKFSFTGRGGVGKLHFQCKVNGIDWTGCGSPVVVTHLKKHKNYTFEVRAIDSRGKKDPTPATKSFKL